MFHSNQKFCISCDDKQLKDVVTLVLGMYKIGDRPPTLAYQVTGDRIAIGRYFDEPKPGWSKFMYDNPGIDLVLAAIKQFTHDHPSHEYSEGEGDGSYRPGYLVEVVEETFADEWKGIKNPWYGIFTVEAYNCYYSK